MNLEIISKEQLDHLFAKSQKSPRKRAIKIFHNDNYSGPQVALNVLQPGSYIKPHLRFDDESLIHYSGRLISVQFDELGNITRKNSFTRESPYLFIPKNTYHSIFSLQENSAFWMVVQGPHDPNNFSRYADWAPEEDGDFRRYFEELQRMVKK